VYTHNVLYYGKAAPLAEQIPLRAGPLALVYEDGDLRYIKLGDIEIVRRIYVAVRDHNWGTPPNHLANVQMEIGADDFEIQYDVTNLAHGIDFAWRGVIRGASDGTITFSMDGVARSTFLRNRLGFCVLHPAECAGRRARIEHVDGAVEDSVFPRAIAPQRIENGQTKPVLPFHELAALAHEIEPGVWAELRFRGEVFELEDQRNWTDASYKTYCTPLRLPFPVEVAAGAHVAQSITLTLHGAAIRQPAGLRAVDPCFTVESSARRPLPLIGLGMASHGRPLTGQEVRRLQVLNLHHLRVDLRAWEPELAHVLGMAAGQAVALGVQLEVALYLSDAYEQELSALAGIVKALNPPIWAWLLFCRHATSTPSAWIAAARRHLRDPAPSALFGSGTDAFFAELNRARPPMQQLDLVTYSINPQGHAFDHASMVESLSAQATTVHSAREFVDNCLLAVSPVTLRMRSNPYATGPEAPPAPGVLPAQVDPRQMSLFGAGWTLGSLKYLAESGANSATYYETTGWRGVMETAAGSPLPQRFHSLPGAVFPLYHVFADLGEFAGGESAPGRASHPLAFDGLVLHKNGRTRVMLANFGPAPQTVTILGLRGAVQVRMLDEQNALAAMQTPEEYRLQPAEVRQVEDGKLSITLLPFGIARLDT